MPYRLPTLGTLGIQTQGDAVSYLDGLVLESVTRRLPLEPMVDRNLNLYLGYQWDTVAPNNFVQRVTVNRILNAIISQVAIQTEQTPKVKFSPRESLEPPVYYLNTSLEATPTPDLVALLQQLPPETQQPWIDPQGQQQFPRPLTDQEVQVVESTIDNAARMAAQTGQETTIPAEILIGINDRIASEVVQTICDAKWDECDGDFKVGENLLYSGIVGWQWMLMDWDDDKSLPVLRNVPWLQVHIDPLATDVRDAQYVIYDQGISADEASALFPELEAEIRQASMPGVLRQAGTQYRQSDVLTAVTFQRDMLTLRTAWLRNQPVPLTPEDALVRGLVSTQIQTITTPVECSCGVGETQPMSQHSEGCECRADYVAPDPVAGLVTDDDQPDTGEGVIPEGTEQKEDGESEESQPQDSTEESQDTDDDQPDDAVGSGSAENAALADNPPTDPAMALPPTHKTTQKTIYYLAKSPNSVQTGNVAEPGEAVEPGGRGWPSRPVLRQMRSIVNTIVDDRECEFVDIPMCLNVNIPIPFSPYGQGEPERLQGLQMAINSVLSDMVTHWHFHAQPAEYLPESVNQTLPSFAQKQYTAAPGTKFVIPDQLWIQLSGKIGGFMDPPNLPPDGWKLIELLLKLIDEESNNSEVLQGKASASWSGEAIQALQKAAKGSIGWKLRRTEYFLGHLFRLVEGCIIHRMPMAQKMQYVRKYPEQAWYPLEERIINLDQSISISIASGSGAKQQAQQATDLSLYDRKLLSPQTILENSGHDPKIELQKILAWVREQQQQQQQLPQGMASQVIAPVPEQGQPPQQPPQLPQPGQQPPQQVPPQAA